MAVQMRLSAGVRDGMSPFLYPACNCLYSNLHTAQRSGKFGPNSINRSMMYHTVDEVWYVIIHMIHK